MQFIVCDGVWSISTGGALDCDGTLSAMTLEEVQQSFAPLTPEQKGAITAACLGFFVLIFVLIRLRRLT